jgi:hypothetical protein
MLLYTYIAYLGYRASITAAFTENLLRRKTLSLYFSTGGEGGDFPFFPWIVQCCSSYSNCSQYFKASDNLYIFMNTLYNKRFWRWCIMLCGDVFMDIIHRPKSKIL